MSEDEILEMLADKLTIETEERHVFGHVKKVDIKLKLDDKVISSDFIELKEIE